MTEVRGCGCPKDPLPLETGSDHCPRRFSAAIRTQRSNGQSILVRQANRIYPLCHDCEASKRRTGRACLSESISIEHFHFLRLEQATNDTLISSTLHAAAGLLRVSRCHCLSFRPHTLVSIAFDLCRASYFVTSFDQSDLDRTSSRVAAIDYKARQACAHHYGFIFLIHIYLLEPNSYLQVKFLEQKPSRNHYTLEV